MIREQTIDLDQTAGGRKELQFFQRGGAIQAEFAIMVTRTGEAYTAQIASGEGNIAAAALGIIINHFTGHSYVFKAYGFGITISRGNVKILEDFSVEIGYV